MTFNFKSLSLWSVHPCIETKHWVKKHIIDGWYDMGITTYWRNSSSLLSIKTMKLCTHLRLYVKLKLYCPSCSYVVLTLTITDHFLTLYFVLPSWGLPYPHEFCHEFYPSWVLETQLLYYRVWAEDYRRKTFQMKFRNKQLYCIWRIL